MIVAEGLGFRGFGEKQKDITSDVRRLYKTRNVLYSAWLIAVSLPSTPERIKMLDDLEKQWKKQGELEKELERIANKPIRNIYKDTIGSIPSGLSGYGVVPLIPLVIVGGAVVTAGLWSAKLLIHEWRVKKYYDIVADVSAGKISPETATALLEKAKQAAEAQEKKSGILGTVTNITKLLTIAGIGVAVIMFLPTIKGLLKRG